MLNEATTRRGQSLDPRVWGWGQVLEAQVKYKYSRNDKQNCLVELIAFTWRCHGNENDKLVMNMSTGMDDSSNFIVD